jgi:hypothetical protein
MKKQHTIPTGIIILLLIAYFIVKPYLSPSTSTPGTTNTESNRPAAVVSNSGSTVSGGSSAANSGIQPADWGKQKKTSGCKVNGKFPDKDCTPGAILSNATKSDVCNPGYSQTVRNVPESEKNQVYDEYGIASHTSGQYEVDHFISLELGGSNDISNLWPEAAEPKPGFHEKDKVENYLHEQVCSGAMTLLEAQTKISSNWLDVYNNIPGK